MAAHTVSIPYVSKDVESLLLWRDVKKTGIVFGSVFAVFLFFMYTTIPTLALACYTVGLLLGACAIWSRFGKTIGKPMPAMPKVLSEGISEDEYKSYADKAKPHVDKAIATAYSLVTCKDLGLQLKVVGALFVAGKVLCNISLFTFSFIAFLVAFGAPIVYEMNKDQIDEIFTQVRSLLSKYYTKAKEELSKVVDKIPAMKNMQKNFEKKTE